MYSKASCALAILVLLSTGNQSQAQVINWNAVVEGVQLCQMGDQDACAAISIFQETTGQIVLTPAPPIPSQFGVQQQEQATGGLDWNHYMQQSEGMRRHDRNMDRYRYYHEHVPDPSIYGNGGHMYVSPYLPIIP